MKRSCLVLLILALTGCAHDAPPRPVSVVQAQAAPVWVNTKTGIYHYQGSRWYGATAQGQLMEEDQAKAAGYRAAYNEY